MAAATDEKPSKPDLKQKANYAPDIYRLLPQSPDAERGVLGSILISPKEVIGMCVEKRLTAAHFHIPSHALIYSALLAMDDTGTPIDIVSLSQHLRDRNKMEQCGGPAFVTQLFTFLPTAANAAYYLEIVQEKFTLREMIRVGTEYAARSYDEQSEVHTLLDSFEEKVLAIASIPYGVMQTMKAHTNDAVVAIDSMYERKGAVTGLSTGFANLDRVCDGLHPGHMFVLAARPSHGKSAFMMNMVEHIAVDLGHAVAVFSLEMSATELVQRMLCSCARVNLRRIRDGFLSERDFPAITTAASKLSTANIFIDDTADLSIQEMRAKARRLKAQNGIVAVFVDYLQLARSNNTRSGDNRQVEVSDISRGLKMMAKELGVPVVALAQLSRGADNEKRDPRLSDLRDSGAIEQDADEVAFLVNDEMKAETVEDKKAVEGQARLIVAKQRSGPLSHVELIFLKEYTRFELRATEPTEEQETLGI